MKVVNGGNDATTSMMLELMDQRLRALERRFEGESVDLSDPVERVKEHCQRVGVYNAKYKWVMPNYYDTSLVDRARELGCRPEQLCKTMIMENKAISAGGQISAQDNASDPSSSRFYMVVVQYSAKLSAQKVSAAIMRLKPGGERISRARCNLQVAPEEVGLSLSGFPHNGVSVFGGLSPIPIILSEAVVAMRPAFIWMGGGHPLFKLGVSTEDLVDRLGAIVADISVPRYENGDNDVHE